MTNSTRKRGVKRKNYVANQAGVALDPKVIMIASFPKAQRLIHARHATDSLEARTI